MALLLQLSKTDTLDTFAKMLATENLTIVTNPSARTAKFNLETRTLILPDWEEFQSIYVRELFRAHECAHALFTPPEGWHDAIEKKWSVRNPLYKDILNILEDARIELSLKRRYPGFKVIFPRGYAELWKAGFFGGRPVKHMNLADRMNIHAKLRQHSSATFSGEEQRLVDRMDLLTTWEQVVELADEVIKLMTKQQQEREKLRQQQEDLIQKALNKKPKGKKQKDEPHTKTDPNYDKDEKLDNPDQPEMPELPPQPSDEEGDGCAAPPDKDKTEKDAKEGEPKPGEGKGDGKEDKDAKPTDGKGKTDEKGEEKEEGQSGKTKGKSKKKGEKSDKTGDEASTGAGGDPMEGIRASTDETYREALEEMAQKVTAAGKVVIMNLFITKPEVLRKHMIKMEDALQSIEDISTITVFGVKGQGAYRG